MIGVIADDLTGAAEIGAVGLRHGLQAEVLLADEPPDHVDLVCLDTDSRSCAPSEAAERAASAARRLRQRRVEWLYKKTDSLLRGNVTPEIEAIVLELGLTGALLIPANPSHGRTIVDGQYYVRRQLIHQTEYAHDLEYPRRTPNVLELCGTPSTLIRSVGKPSAPLPESGFIIGEAASLHDLRCWGMRRRENWLMAGGAEFFGALLKPAAPLPQGQPVPGKELFVCGSASDATRKFVADQAQFGVPVVSLPERMARLSSLEPAEVIALSDQAVLALRRRSRAILAVGLPQVQEATQGRMLAEQLVRVAKAVLRRIKLGHVFVEGGATAVALARRMGWTRLKVLAELAPGVVDLSVTDGRSQLVLTIKPGSYAWPIFLRHA